MPRKAEARASKVPVHTLSRLVGFCPPEVAFHIENIWVNFLKAELLHKLLEGLWRCPFALVRCSESALASVTRAQLSA